jgi:hypothetical protein
VTTHVYPAAVVGFQNETLDWTAEDIKAILLGPGFSYDGSLIYVDELPSQHIIATSNALENRTFANGLAVADPAGFLQLLSNLEITHVVLYQDTGAPAYSPLIAHYDVDSIIGAPKTPTGEDIFVYYISPPGGFFQFTDGELVGPIDTYLIADDIALAELEGGITLVLPSVLLDTRLNVRTHVVCAPPEEGDDCCEPTIRSSRCD